MLEIGKYTQKKPSPHIVSITYYNPWLKPRLSYLHSRYFQGISATLFFIIVLLLDFLYQVGIFVGSRLEKHIGSGYTSVFMLSE